VPEASRVLTLTTIAVHNGVVPMAVLAVVLAANQALIEISTVAVKEVAPEVEPEAGHAKNYSVVRERPCTWKA